MNDPEPGHGLLGRWGVSLAGGLSLLRVAKALANVPNEFALSDFGAEYVGPKPPAAVLDFVRSLAAR